MKTVTRAGWSNKETSSSVKDVGVQLQWLLVG